MSFFLIFIACFIIGMVAVELSGDIDAKEIFAVIMFATVLTGVVSLLMFMGDQIPQTSRDAIQAGVEFVQPLSNNDGWFEPSKLVEK